MNIEWVAPPADLRALVHTFYLLEVGDEVIDEPIPAYSAQLSIYLQGAAALEYQHGGTSRTGSVFLNAPQLRAGRIRLTGPARVAGASLTPLGWAALVGQPVDKLHDCAIAPEQFAAREVLDEIEQWRNEGGTGQEPLARGLQFLERILRTAPHPIKPQHREFVERFNAWLIDDLNPSLEALYRQLPIGERQVQRLSRQFFGAPPTQVLMRHRAIRTAMLLSNPDLPEPLYDELSTAYFDQPHMIRDIRRFTGRTPASFSRPSLAKESLNPDGHGVTAKRIRGAAGSEDIENDSQEMGSD